MSPGAHHIPHTGRAQIGPVTSTIVQNTTPTSALVTASTSRRGPGNSQPIRKYAAGIASTVVATALGSIPAVIIRLIGGRYVAITPTTPITMTVHFMAARAEGLLVTRYWIEAMKLMKN